MNRRRQRSVRQIDYAALDEGDVSDPDGALPKLGTNFQALLQSLLNYEGYVEGPATAVAEAINADWVSRGQLSSPTVVRAAPGATEKLGLQLPADQPLTVQSIVSLAGYNTEVTTLDSGTQREGPRWSLHQWQLYWQARCSGKDLDAKASASAARREAALQKGITADSKKRLLIGYLPVDGTPLQELCSPPTTVQEADLLQRCWPTDEPGKPTAQQLQLQMAPAACYTDFRLGPSGAASWQHMLQGRRLLALVPPTPRNLATYAAWAAAARQAGVFLAQHCEGVVRLEAGPGDTVFVPGGWVFAEASAEDTMALGGTFMHARAMGMQLEAWRLEEHLWVRSRARFPRLQELLWHTAGALVAQLRAAAGLPTHELSKRCDAIAATREAVQAEAAAVQAAKQAARQGIKRPAAAAAAAVSPDAEDSDADVGLALGKRLRRPRQVSSSEEGEEEGGRATRLQRRPQRLADYSEEDSGSEDDDALAGRRDFAAAGGQLPRSRRLAARAAALTQAGGGISGAKRSAGRAVSAAIHDAPLLTKSPSASSLRIKLIRQPSEGGSQRQGSGLLGEDASSVRRLPSVKLKWGGAGQRAHPPSPVRRSASLKIRLGARPPAGVDGIAAADPNSSPGQLQGRPDSGGRKQARPRPAAIPQVDGASQCLTAPALAVHWPAGGEGAVRRPKAWLRAGLTLRGPPSRHLPQVDGAADDSAGGAASPEPISAAEVGGNSSPAAAIVPSNGKAVEARRDVLDHGNGNGCHAMPAGAAASAVAAEAQTQPSGCAMPAGVTAASPKDPSAAPFAAPAAAKPVAVSDQGNRTGRQAGTVTEAEVETMVAEPIAAACMHQPDAVAEKGRRHTPNPAEPPEAVSASAAAARPPVTLPDAGGSPKPVPEGASRAAASAASGITDQQERGAPSPAATAWQDAAGDVQTVAAVVAELAAAVSTAALAGSAVEPASDPTSSSPLPPLPPAVAATPDAVAAPAGLALVEDDGAEPAGGVKAAREAGEGPVPGWVGADLAPLLALLQAWLEDAQAAEHVPAVIPDPQRLLDEMQVCMEALGIPTTPPPSCIDLTAVAPQSLMPKPAAKQAHPKQELVQDAAAVDANDAEDNYEGGSEVEEEAGESVPDLLARRGQQHNKRPKLGKKLSVKERLMKKLRIR